MKMILSVIRIAKMNETKKALSDAGLPSFTAKGVLGRGRGRGIGPNYEQVLKDSETKELLEEFGPEPRLKSKRMIHWLYMMIKKTSPSKQSSRSTEQTTAVTVKSSSSIQLTPFASEPGNVAIQRLINRR